MTIDHPLRRVLARLCSADTMSRVVDPTLADMRVERGRPTWRGYLSLARALTVHAIASVPAALARVCADDDRAVPRVARLFVGIAFVGALPLLMVPMLGPLRDGIAMDAFGGVRPRSPRTPTMFLLLLPRALALTLAPAMLIAPLLALRGRPITARLVRRVIELAVLSCVAMGVLINWGTPLANRRFRVFVNGTAQSSRDERVTALAALRRQMESLHFDSRMDPAARIRVKRWVEYQYQTRLALIASPLPVALLGVAVVATRAARRRPGAMGLLATTGYAVVICVLDGLAIAGLRGTSISPILLAWLPTAVLLLIGGVMVRVNRQWPIVNVQSAIGNRQ